MLHIIAYYAMVNFSACAIVGTGVIAQVSSFNKIKISLICLTPLYDFAFADASDQY
jgi:hypothetical protein